MTKSVGRVEVEFLDAMRGAGQMPFSGRLRCGGRLPYEPKVVFYRPRGSDDPVKFLYVDEYLAAGLGEEVEYRLRVRSMKCSAPGEHQEPGRLVLSGVLPNMSFSPDSDFDCNVPTFRKGNNDDGPLGELQLRQCPCEFALGVSYDIEMFPVGRDEI